MIANESNIIGIYGASGFGREVLSVARSQYVSQETRFVFIDDNASGIANNADIIKFDNFIELDGAKRAVIAIADSAIRKKLHNKCIDVGLNFAHIQSPTVTIGDGVQVGDASIICGFSTFTCNIKIGLQFHCNIYSYVAHDCIIGDFVTFAPGVKCNGNVIVEDHAYIGTGAILKQGTPEKPLVIGAGSVVGMGAVVTKDVPSGSTVIGNPARQLDRK